MTRSAIHESVHLVLGTGNELLVESEVSYCGTPQ